MHHYFNDIIKWNLLIQKTMLKVAAQASRSTTGKGIKAIWETHTTDYIRHKHERKIGCEITRGEWFKTCELQWSLPIYNRGQNPVGRTLLIFFLTPAQKVYQSEEKT